MVGRRNTLLVTKRSLRNADSAAGKRPKRILPAKLMDETVGMSRQEEQELNKALYASLQENRRSKSMPSLLSESSDKASNNNNSHSNTSSSSSRSISTTSSRRSLPHGSKSSKLGLGRRRSLRTAVTSPLRPFQLSFPSSSAHKRVKTGHTLSSQKSSTSHLSSISVDESSQDSVRSSSSSVNGSKRKIHAQRKFAQGCSLPGTPSSTPAKLTTPPVKKISSRIPKTEDFLTFLCLRGTSILPPHLDFFNYSREELPSRDEGARPASAGKVKRRREGTPDSSSTSSGANDEVAEAAEAAEGVSTPSLASKCGGGSSLLAKRSAARASAGTPETARGIVSLRQGLQRKVSSSCSSRSSSPRFHVTSTSPYFSPCRVQQQTPSTSAGTVLINPVYRNPLPPPRNHRPKFYFTPEKSPSPSKASGVRPGEFTPPSLQYGSPYFGSVRNFSPLVCRPSTSKSASPGSMPVARHDLSSSSSSTYPSSSRSSWSSVATDGTPRRYRQGTLPLSRDDAGKVTPVCTTSTLFPREFSVSKRNKVPNIHFSPSFSHSFSSAVSSISSLQLPSSSDVSSLSDLSPISVTSFSTACLLNSPSAYNPAHHVNKPELPECSSSSELSLKNLQLSHLSAGKQLSPLHLPEISDPQRVSNCCLPVSNHHPPSLDLTENSCLGPQCVSPSYCHNSRNSVASDHRNLDCPSMHADPVACARSLVYRENCKNLPGCWSFGCKNNDNSNINRYCASNPNSKLVHVTIDNSLHGYNSSCLPNLSHLNSRMPASCLSYVSPSTSDECCLLPRQSSQYPYSHSHTACAFNVSHPRCEPKRKYCVSRMSVCKSCTCESPSLSGQGVSTRPEWESAAKNDCKKQKRVIEPSVQQKEKNKDQVIKFLTCESEPCDNNCKCNQFCSKVPADLSSGNESAGKLSESGADKTSLLSDTELDEGQFAEHDIKDYDFTIIDQGQCKKHTREKLKSIRIKRSDKNTVAKTRVKKKKHKKHRRKRRRIKQADFTIPKLTIRISKKQKVFSCQESNESSEPQKKRQSNFQQEFLKMLEVRKGPKDGQPPHRDMDCPENFYHPISEASDEGWSSYLLSDYKGCVSESEMFVSRDASPVDHLQDSNITDEFHPSHIERENKDGDGKVALSQHGNLLADSHGREIPFGQSISKNVHVRNTLASAHRVPGPGGKIHPDSDCSAVGEEEISSAISRFKKRAKFRKAYSKFNTQDLVLSDTATVKKTDFGTDEPQLNVMALEDKTFCAKKELFTPWSEDVIDLCDEDETSNNLKRRPFSNDQIDKAVVESTLSPDRITTSDTEKMSPCPKGKSNKLIESVEKDCEKRWHCKKADCKLALPRKTQRRHKVARGQASGDTKKRRDKSQGFRERELIRPGQTKTLKKSEGRKRFGAKAHQRWPMFRFGKNPQSGCKKDHVVSAQTKSFQADENDADNKLFVDTKLVDNISIESICEETEEGQCSKRSRNLSYLETRNCALGKNFLCGNDTGEQKLSEEPELARKAVHEEASYFEKGKSLVINRILDWASTALYEIAGPCSYLEDHSKRKYEPFNAVKTNRISSKCPQPHNSKVYRLKMRGKVGRRVSNLYPTKINSDRKPPHKSFTCSVKGLKMRRKNFKSVNKSHCQNFAGEMATKSSNTDCDRYSSGVGINIQTSPQKLLECDSEKAVSLAQSNIKTISCPSAFSADKLTKTFSHPAALSGDILTKTISHPAAFSTDNSTMTISHPAALSADNSTKTISHPAAFSADNSIKTISHPAALSADNSTKTISHPAAFSADSSTNITEHFRVGEKEAQVTVGEKINGSYFIIGDSDDEDQVFERSDAPAKHCRKVDLEVQKNSLGQCSKNHIVTLAVLGKKNLAQPTLSGSFQINDTSTTERSELKLSGEESGFHTLQNVRFEGLATNSSVDNKRCSRPKESVVTNYQYFSPLNQDLPDSTGAIDLSLGKHKRAFKMHRKNYLDLQSCGNVPNKKSKEFGKEVVGKSDFKSLNNDVLDRVMTSNAEEEKSNLEAHAIDYSRQCLPTQYEKTSEQIGAKVGSPEAKFSIVGCKEYTTDNNVRQKNELTANHVSFKDESSNCIVFQKVDESKMKEEESKIGRVEGYSSFEETSLLNKKVILNDSVQDMIHEVCSFTRKTFSGVALNRLSCLDEQKASSNFHNGGKWPVCSSKHTQHGNMSLATAAHANVSDNPVTYDEDVIEVSGENGQANTEIALHSFGSLNTGQGFLVVDGRLEKCRILNKGQHSPEKTHSVGFNELQRKNSVTDQTIGALTNCSQHLDVPDQEDGNESPNSIVQADPAYFTFGQRQSTHSERISSPSNFVSSKELNLHFQPVHFKDDMKDSLALDTCRRQIPESTVTGFAPLNQTRPQLQRSIYLEAKDKQHKKLKIEAHGSPSTNVKIVQSQLYPSESSL
ncbi:protein jumonji [Plakobranchus ocellatus]|uniref:Protein jumonji n=1 Tax=Plakobranchus ocellatus TaxID=259542 RepID=A0AAV3ZL09_9GAST|nr:protein jumonji [Plakobranchus ocellatus]